MSKNPVLNTYNFVSTSNRQPSLDSDQYQLVIRQQPKQARLCSSKERDRRPLDPPPIIQLKIDGYGDEAQNFLQSPYYFMCANLVHPTDNSESFTISSRYLAGTVVSSLHKLKDIDNNDGGFFVFGDISVRVEGRYRLRFSLFEIVRDEVVHIQSAISDVFTVYSPKTFPGMSESTFLSRSFSDQGVRIRIRKEHRIQMKRPQSNNRQSDTAECEDDNMNDDGIGEFSIKRKRSLSNPMQLLSISTPTHETPSMNMMDAAPSAYYPTSQPPYASSHSQFPSRQRGGALSYPPPLGYSQSHMPPQRHRSYYDDSEHESSSHDERMSVHSLSVDLMFSSPSYHDNKDHEQFERSILNKRPRLSNPEVMSYDYQQPPTTTPLNNNRFTNPHHTTASPPIPTPSSSYRKTQRRTTLPPLLEHQSSYVTTSTNTSNSHSFSHSSLPPTRHHSFDTLPSAVSSSTSLESFHYPITSSTTTQQSQPPATSYYHRPPPKTPVRSRTLPYMGRSDNSNHNMYHQSHHIQSTASSSHSNQLPTPKTSFDNKQLHSSYYYHPLTPPNQNNSSVDSYNNGNNSNNVNNDAPSFTQQFTLSPRPAHFQLPSKPNDDNNNGITKTHVGSNTNATFLNNES
ncbi:18031_t:CDS:2, partial [Funneliformis geosporum]